MKENKKGKFLNKTLLMLGSNVGSVEMVQYARENGAHTITADNLEVENSEAKSVSDESVLISTADIESLSKLIEERHIDGVLAGISEFNLLRAMELSQRHHLRFYCNLEQWESIEHKERFRKLCIDNNVPCPKTYFVGSQLLEHNLKQMMYPLVLKPIDCSASQGVYICADQEELLANFENAKISSDAGKVIIEEFVKGDEFTVHYTICNGKASLSCLDNRYSVAVHEGKVTTIPVARIYPSTFIDKYIEKVNPSMLNLCENIGVQHGVLFVQGIYNMKTEQIWIFEGGLRSAAETPNRLIARINKINYMNHLVDYALLGKSELNQTKEDPYMKGQCCGIISFVAKHGKVGMIDGLEEAIAATPSVISYESRYPVGSITPDTDTLRQLMIRFVMICDSREQMAKDVAYLNDHITVLNEKGENMVIKLDPARILSEFIGVQ